MSRNSGSPWVPRSTVGNHSWSVCRPRPPRRPLSPAHSSEGSSSGSVCIEQEKMLHTTGSLVWGHSVRLMGYLVFANCSFSTMVLNTEPKVRVRRPVEGSFQTAVSEAWIPWSSGVTRALWPLWLRRTSNGALSAPQLAHYAKSVLPFYLRTLSLEGLHSLRRKCPWEGVVGALRSCWFDFPGLQAGVSDIGGSDVILVFLTHPGLVSLCMKREAFRVCANFCSESWRCKLKGFTGRMLPVHREVFVRIHMGLKQ